MLRIIAFVSSVLAILSSASQADEINVYSYRQPGLIKPLFAVFTADTGISVNVAFIKQGMVERLISEGERSPADLIMTVDISRLDGLVKAGVTEAVISEVLKKNIPAKFRDPSGHWFGLTLRARIVYASRERVADGEITTYEDLASKKWSGRICMRSGINAYNLALISAVIAHHGENGARSWLSNIKANLARKTQGNDRAQVKAIHAGECDISIGNTYYMKKMLENKDQLAWAKSVRIVFPSFEKGGTHVNLSGMALTKSAPNKDNAIRLMEWLSSETAQKIYAERNGEYPLKPDTTISDLVASWGTFISDDIPLTDISGLRANSLRIVEEVAFDE